MNARLISAPPEYSGWATNRPEYKVAAVQIAPSNGQTEWQEDYAEQSEHSCRMPVLDART